jgi:pyrrolidone-carboxylate peptidase
VEDQQPVDIVTSDNPGMYLCGYIFRASLLEAEKRGDEWRKRVAFLHVPPEGKKYGVQTGREVVLKVVEGMVRDGEGVRQ